MTIKPKIVDDLAWQERNAPTFDVPEGAKVTHAVIGGHVLEDRAGRLIEVAMTTLEWSDALSEPGVVEEYLIETASKIEYRDQPALRHGLAALCLYGQPFGFTRDMLLALKTILSEHVGCDRGPIGDGWKSEELLRMVEFAEKATDCIEALLPPESP